ncbi:MAG: hypothetical protein JXR40_04190 [Pontiellaceae bacterium]|nr:hypothetical protein [Pontiellaceae bacterium]
MKLALALLLIGALSTGAIEESYVEKMIAVDENQEMYIGDAYDLFLRIISGETIIDAAEVQFPKSMLDDHGEVYILGWAFYISPNEFRGFELVFPKSVFTEKDGILTNSCKLALDKSDTKQGTVVFVLKEYIPPKVADSIKQ